MASNSTSTGSASVAEAAESETPAQTDELGSQQETAETTEPVDTADDGTAAEPAAEAPETARPRRQGGHFAGAGAIVSAALGAISLSGTPLSEMLRTNQRMSGQIQAQSGANVDQIHVLYSAPWHTAALSNGIVALIAVLLGGSVLAAFLQSDSQRWVKAVALSGVVLGALGVLVAGGMYFDLFASPPELPKMPTLGGMR